MRIRTRLSLLFILCSTASLLACGSLLLRASVKSMIRSAEDNAVSELNMLRTSFSPAAAKALNEGGSEAVRRSVVVYVFQSYADDALSGSQYVLRRGAQTLYNNSGYAPEALLGGLDRNTATAEGRQLFAAGTETDLLRETYHIYLIRDVTELYDAIDGLRLRFALICAAAVLLSAALILFFTSRTLRPLRTLEDEAAAMARGEYRARIPLPDGERRDEIAAVSESFNRMAAAVEHHVDDVTRLAEERRMLIGALTHEMKTPLTAVIGYAELLDRARLTEEQRAEAAAFIHRESGRLERLTQRMMQLVTLADGAELALADTSARALFDMAKDALDAIAARHGAALAYVENGERFAMDPDLMTSVLINLVDNACSAGARHVTVAARGGTISVSDDGCGMPREILDKVTQPFFRADKARSRGGGHAGLGLALADRVAQRHHARLIIESREGAGATVSLRFDP